MDNFEKYVGQVLDKRYKLNRVIGIGGMAVVFEAHDLARKRVVAVKMIKDEIAGEAQTVKRFINGVKGGLDALSSEHCKYLRRFGA